MGSTKFMAAVIGSLVIGAGAVGASLAQDGGARGGAPPATRPAGAGTVTGFVTDADGNAIPGARVVLVEPGRFRGGDGGPRPGGPGGGPPGAGEQRPGRRGGAPGDGPNGDDVAPAAGDRPDRAARRAERRERMRDVEPVATVETDEAGKFTLANVPAGRYVVHARMRGVGHDGQRVRVRDAGTTDVELILEPPRRGRADGPRGPAGDE